MIRLFVILLLAVVPLSAAAQDYPAFVGTEDTTDTLPLIEPPGVLTADLLSTETWQATRIRVEASLEELRLLALTRTPPASIRAKGAQLQADLELIAAMATHQAPNQEDAIVWYGARLSKQIAIFIDEYTAGEGAAIESVDRMIRQSTRDLNALLVRSDQERAGQALTPSEPFPPGWIPAAFNDPDYAVWASALSTQRLVSEITSLVELLEDSTKPRGAQASPRAPLELAILSRELARRDFELPVTARQPFRDTVLRMDVLAENISTMSDPRYRLHARRQARHLRLCLREVESYLALTSLTGE